MKVDFEPVWLSIKYLVHSGYRNQTIDLKVEPDCVNKAEILDQIKIVSIDSNELSNEQVLNAISLEKSDLILSIFTDDFITYLDKNVTLEIGLEDSEFAPQ